MVVVGTVLHCVPSLKAYSFLLNYSDCWLLLSHSDLSQGRQLSSLRDSSFFSGRYRLEVMSLFMLL